MYHFSICFTFKALKTENYQVKQMFFTTTRKTVTMFTLFKIYELKKYVRERYDKKK